MVEENSNNLAHNFATEDEERDFGQLLRHELNNPLTGILGNAELLVADLRRNQLELPPSCARRLEIIIALAVRMRETVRNLSERLALLGGNNPSGLDQRMGADPLAAPVAVRAEEELRAPHYGTADGLAKNLSTRRLNSSGS